MEVCRYAAGSSPRMRGAHLRKLRSLVEVGIIPAYAGSTLAASLANRRRWDHPRVCGEHWADLAGMSADAGSSPRMRGALGRPRGHERGRGIIPAYAGSTWQANTRACMSRDHPRVCGEHDLPRLTCGEIEGSSPRMRGAQWPTTRKVGALGIIPAYAGSTPLLDVLAA